MPTGRLRAVVYTRKHNNRTNGEWPCRHERHGQPNGGDEKLEQSAARKQPAAANASDLDLWLEKVEAMGELKRITAEVDPISKPRRSLIWSALEERAGAPGREHQGLIRPESAEQHDRPGPRVPPTATRTFYHSAQGGRRCCRRSSAQDGAEGTLLPDAAISNKQPRLTGDAIDIVVSRPARTVAARRGKHPHG